MPLDRWRLPGKTTQPLSCCRVTLTSALSAWTGICWVNLIADGCFDALRVFRVSLFVKSVEIIPTFFKDEANRFLLSVAT